LKCRFGRLSFVVAYSVGLELVAVSGDHSQLALLGPDGVWENNICYFLFYFSFLTKEIMD
jgi:hypothetical protein